MFYHNNSFKHVSQSQRKDNLYISSRMIATQCLFAINSTNIATHVITPGRHHFCYIHLSHTSKRIRHIVKMTQHLSKRAGCDGKLLGKYIYSKRKLVNIDRLAGLNHVSGLKRDNTITNQSIVCLCLCQH